MLSTRVITAIIFGLVLLGSLFLGGIVWALFVGLVTAIGFSEYLRLWAKAGQAVTPSLALAGWAAALAWPLAAYLLGPGSGAAGSGGLATGLGSVSLGGLATGLNPAGPGGPYAGLLLGLSLGLILTLLVLTYPRSSSTGALGLAAGTLYVGWTLSHLVLLRAAGPLGFWRTLLVFGGVWGTDVLAYAVGSLFGRHKLKPSLSPGKSVEGAAGGLLGGLLAAWLVGIPLGLPVGLRLGLGLALGVLGQVGDLAESALKRHAGVKDSGSLLPGHGGILDRFDSSLFAAPVVYYLLALWLQKGGGF